MQLQNSVANESEIAGTTTLRDDQGPAPRFAATKSGAPLKIGFVLLDCFTIAAFSSFIDAIRLAADKGARSRQIHCAWTIMSDGPVRSSCGLRAQTDEPPGAPERFDYVAVCGGNGYEDRALLRKPAAFLQEADRRGVGLIGLCTGSFALAEAGLLDGCVACIHWNMLESFQRNYPKIEARSDRLFIESRGRITCAGSVGGADLAMHLVARHCGPEKAQQAARHMMLQGGRPADYPQPHFLFALDESEDPVVRRTALLMEQSMNEFRTTAWFAEAVGLSVRQLERRFQRAIGLSPAAVFRRLRLDHAAALLARTEMPILEVAVVCGFVDGPHLARDFKACFGVTPGERRAEARKTPRR